MLYYEKGKIKFGSVYVKIPDGVYIETEPEMSYELGLELVSPNDDYRITIQGDADKQNALEYITSVTQGVGYRELGKTLPVQICGLFGWQVRYGDPQDRTVYYEVALDIPETSEAKVLDIYVRIETPADREQIINGRIVQDLLNGITLA